MRAEVSGLMPTSDVEKFGIILFCAVPATPPENMMIHDDSYHVNVHLLGLGYAPLSAAGSATGSALSLKSDRVSNWVGDRIGPRP